MTEQKKKKTNPGIKEVRKSFLTGTAFDERTVKSSLAFFGTMILVLFVSFITCLSAASDNTVLRILINGAAIVLALIIYYNNGSKRGTEDVKKGEILWQKQEKGLPFSESERKFCFHPLKGYLIGLLGSAIFIIPAIYLAVNTSVQMTEAGTLPSWMQAYTKRSDIGNALISYTQPEGMQLLDYIRAVVRITILPYVNIAGGNGKPALLTMERLSPLILLLPAAAYGTGYLSGRSIRTQIHTAISENDRKRIRREQKRRKARAAQGQKREPEQLN